MQTYVTYLYHEIKAIQIFKFLESKLHPQKTKVK